MTAFFFGRDIELNHDCNCNYDIACMEWKKLNGHWKAIMQMIFFNRALTAKFIYSSANPLAFFVARLYHQPLVFCWLTKGETRLE
jgi:hypothetical protein